MKCFSRSVIAALLVAAAAAPAAAQEQRTTLTITPAFATVGGDTEMAISGSIGYRFAERLSFEGDFTWIDAAAGGFGNREFGSGAFATNGVIGGLTGAFLNDIVQIGSPTTRPGGGRGEPFFNVANTLPTIIRTVGAGELRADTTGQTMIGTLGLRFEPLVQTARFRPYVSGGIGLNHTEQEFNIAAAAMTVTGTRGNTTAANTMPAFDDSVSHSGFAFSAGGGANIRLFSSLWANLDTKYFRLSRDRNVMRLGGGVSFRF